MKMPSVLATVALFGLSPRPETNQSDVPIEGADLIGTPAPAWVVSEWINSPPLTLSGATAAGKVVLVRWFMSTECPYCTVTAPALNELYRTYGSRGLLVVGMYHHKRSEPLDVRRVNGWVRDFGFQFPVAVDRNWRTLRRWWLDGQRRTFTSVTFLIDRNGIIRRIHPGGSLALGSKDYQAMKSAIEILLKESRVDQ